MDNQDLIIVKPGCFVFVQDQNSELVIANFGSLGSIGLFAKGPEFAKLSVAEYDAVELDEPVTIEGGFLIDFDSKCALVFGNTEVNDAMGYVEYKAHLSLQESSSAFLEHVSQNWPDWNLVWSNDGVQSFSAYLRGKNLTNDHLALIPPDLVVDLSHIKSV